MKRALIIVLILQPVMGLFAQRPDVKEKKYPPFVNQLGYNLGESKRFVCYGAKDDTPFRIINTATSKAVFEGTMLNFEGWFSEFDPVSAGDQYVIEVEEHGQSVPFWIADHLMEKASSKLAYFLLLAPDEAPEGIREKLAAWAVHMKQKTNNFWKYRVHSETEWAHPKTKELGGAPALAGSMFVIGHLLDDPQLRNIGWAQVDFVFGVNPLGTHLSNKSDERVEIGSD